MANDNIFLLIIWQNARHKENEILSLIASNFTILKEYAITWNPENFSRNMVAFSYGCLVSTDFHYEHKGNGEFVVILAEDKKPKYEERSTAQGNVLVNNNSYDIKYKIRTELLDNKASFHTTNNIKETRHDLALLLGINLDDWLKNTVLDGTRETMKRNTTPVEGYKTLADVFYLLNETCDYVVLRNFAELPDKVQIDEHTDIDILVDDLQNFITTLRADTEWRSNLFEIRNYAWVSEAGIDVLFHVKFVGDDYYDENFERKLLKTRIKDTNNVYRPCTELYFWSLLYHALYQKVKVSESYPPILTRIANEYGIDYVNEPMKMCNLLDNWLRQQNYKITPPFENWNKSLNVSDVFLGRSNILTPTLIDNENKFLLLRSRHGVAIFSKRLIGINAELASNLVMFGEGRGMAPFLNYSAKLLAIDSLELKPYRKWLKADTLFLSFRKKFGKVSLVLSTFDGTNTFIRKKYLNTSSHCIRTKNIILHTKEEIEYFEGITGVSLLRKTTDPIGTLEAFVEVVFDNFSSPKNSSILKGIAFDMTMDNCIYNGDWHFFDFEYELRYGIEKSYMLYRIAKYCRYGNVEQVYAHLCNKYNHPNMWDYWERVEAKIFMGVTDTPRQFKSCSGIVMFLVKVFCKLISLFINTTNIKKRLIEYFCFSRDYKLYKQIFGEENI